MSASWQYRDELMVVTETGVTSNAEIERVFVEEALAHRRLPVARGLWDARASENVLSSDDFAWRFERLNDLARRGLLSRLAVLIRAQPQRLVLARQELPKALDALEVAVFADESEALHWLERATRQGS